MSHKVGWWTSQKRDIREQRKQLKVDRAWLIPKSVRTERELDFVHTSVPFRFGSLRFSCFGECFGVINVEAHAAHRRMTNAIKVRKPIVPPMSYVYVALFVHQGAPRNSCVPATSFYPRSWTTTGRMFPLFWPCLSSGDAQHELQRWSLIHISGKKTVKGKPTKEIVSMHAQIVWLHSVPATSSSTYIDLLQSTCRCPCSTTASHYILLVRWIIHGHIRCLVLQHIPGTAVVFLSSRFFTCLPYDTGRLECQRRSLINASQKTRKIYQNQTKKHANSSYR